MINLKKKIEIEAGELIMLLAVCSVIAVDRELSANKNVLDKLLEVKGHEFLANSMGEVITGCLLESGLSMSDIMKNLEICISATILNQELV